MSHQSDLIAEDIQAYLKQHENKELLRLLTCGSVDDGKSTLIGRLLHDTKGIYEDQLAAVEGDSKKYGTQGGHADLALLVDGLRSERDADQGQRGQCRDDHGQDFAPHRGDDVSRHNPMIPSRTSTESRARL